jgi:hypothetical protein
MKIFLKLLGKTFLKEFLLLFSAKLILALQNKYPHGPYAEFAIRAINTLIDDVINDHLNGR